MFDIDMWNCFNSFAAKGRVSNSLAHLTRAVCNQPTSYSIDPRHVCYVYAFTLFGSAWAQGLPQSFQSAPAQMASLPGRELPFDRASMMDSKDFEDEFDKLGTGQPCDAELECASLSLNTTQTQTVYVHVLWG